MGAFPNGGVGGVLVAVAKLGLVLKIFVLQGQRQLGGDKVALGRHGDGLPGKLWGRLSKPTAALGWNRLRFTGSGRGSLFAMPSNPAAKINPITR